MKKFTFPIFKKIIIKQFSLYKKATLLEIDLQSDVFCLAGANGLGKSTFIAILNYALTGVVKKPNTTFAWYKSIPSFYNKSKGFVEDYFDGRIVEDDFDFAEVTLVFTIQNKEYEITRGFFEPDELRSFSKTADGSKMTIRPDLSFSDLNDLYKREFTKDIKLADFDQFVFLQFYVLTFDETHQLLFWDENLIERVLYLFFGVDATKAKLADQLRKDYNKYTSDAKNIQWRITQTRGELKTITKTLSSFDPNKSSNIEAFEVHKNLIEQLDELIAKSQAISEGINDADLQISNLSLMASSLRSEYSTVFNQTLIDDTPIERDSDVIEILNDLKLRIFAAQNFDDLIEKLVETIRNFQKFSAGKDSEEYYSRLRSLDDQLSQISKQIEETQKRKDRLIVNEDSCTLELKGVTSKIELFERENEGLVESIRRLRENSTVDSVLKAYQEQIERLNVQKEEAYERRDKARKELEPLEAELSVGYVEAENEFIPKVNQYAKSFLGLDLNINLAISRKGVASLSIDIDDSVRRDSFQLSESQRYFVDIALRMALVDLMASSATLLIDTPEGSLDIAYESRAGKMFADFANSNRKLILTANINTSELLLELAKLCKSARMRLERMTDWTILSDVQQQESLRIEEAYSKIEAKLVEPSNEQPHSNI